MPWTISEFVSRLRELAARARPVWLGGQAGALAPAAEEDTTLALCSALGFQSDPRAQGVPEVCCEAFAASPLAAGSPLLAGRERELESLTACVSAWRAGDKTMLAVTGPAGCGLSSFLRQIETLTTGGERVCYHRLDVRPRDSAEALAIAASLFDITDPPADFDALRERALACEPHILVLDGGHALASRIMGSAQAMRGLGALMVATLERHLWVVGSHEQAWRRLIYLHQADRYFSHHIALGYLDASGLEATITARLERSGYRLAPGDTATPGANDTALPRALADLQRLSQGKPDLAFFHLLRAATFAPGEREFNLGAWRKLDYSPLRQLDRDDYFTLAEIAAHGGLGAAEHQAIFRARPEDTRLRLAHLGRLGLVECPPGNAGQYRLVPLFAEAIIAHLVNGNYLY